MTSAVCRNRILKFNLQRPCKNVVAGLALKQRIQELPLQFYKLWRCVSEWECVRVCGSNCWVPIFLSIDSHMNLRMFQITKIPLHWSWSQILVGYCAFVRFCQFSFCIVPGVDFGSGFCVCFCLSDLGKEYFLSLLVGRWNLWTQNGDRQQQLSSGGGGKRECGHIRGDPEASNGGRDYCCGE